nr:MAG TPA: Terminase large subunit [Caudoviricetes sp.]
MKLRTSSINSFVMNINSKELYINMGNDIPLWNDLYSYEEQDDDVKQFWENEAMKLLNGVTINGVFIHPWLYWHINFWKMMIDVGEDRIPGNSQLRDNEWMFAEFLKQAEEENKGIFMFGCRRFGKALLDSEILYLEDREKMIGNIVVGDKIYDDKGNLVEVVGVYPQGKVTTYRVVFEDGRNVICCGNHQWRVNHGGKWHVRSLRAIAGLDYKSMSIPVGEALNYPTAKLPVPPSAYASMLAAYLGGYSGDMFFDKYVCKKFLRSSIDQKKDFIENFIRSFRNVVTGEEELMLSHIDMDVINFVQRMFWASGWYAKLEGNKLILSRNRKELKIRSISIYGKEHATCITVDNDSHLFLTTNYIVTHNTAIMSSFLARNATMTYNLTHNVIGSSKEDLMSLGEYLEFGLDNIHPYLRINRTGNDWFKEVIMGTKTVNNIRDVHARIRITNIDSGKAGASLKTASGTPYTSIYDEVGKFPFLAAYLQGRPAHMMHGRMRGMMICSGTGGNVEKSQDAQKVMNNPAEYGFIVMNYDLLNKRCLKPTWRISQSGCFVPAQMSHAYDKETTTLDKYLGIEKATGLKKIDIQVSKFDDNTKKIKSRLDELVKKDRALYVQERMAFPLSIDDCFLNTNVNRFPVEDALKHKSRLLEEGRPGKTVDIYQTDGMKMGYHFSDKQLADYPFQGGNIDAPIVIYENPPEDGGIFDFTYVSGCLLPGERVLTDKGWKYVEDVKYEDKLVNKDGEYVFINKRLLYNKIDEDVYDVKMYNGVSITRFTKEHPLYVSDNKLKNGKIICEDLFSFDFVKVSDVKSGMWIKYPNIYRKEIYPCKELFPYVMSDDLWYLIGAWIGNGYSRIDKHHVGIYISTHKNNDKFIKKIDDICKSCFGKYTNKRFRDNSCEIFCSVKEFAIWMDSTFGKYANGKFIPEWVKYIPHEYKVSFLCGYLDTDGCCYAVNGKKLYTIEYTSCNLKLLESVQDILFSIGIVSNIKINKNDRSDVIQGHFKKSNCLYYLSFGTNGILKLLSFGISSVKLDGIIISDKIIKAKKKGCFISSDGNYIYIRIKSIEKELYSGPVYNFDCDTHTYLCHHITTHNCDPYKSDKADTDSVGTFYVLKRYVKINDPFAYCIVASYASRPPSSDDFCRNCEMLQEAYGAKCLMENADRMYELYLTRRNKQLMLLEDGERLAGKIIRAGARQNNKLGLAPTVPNQRMLFNTVIQYCWEDVVVGYDDDGNEITQKGIYRIPDIELLDEIIAFGPGVNTDRIIAFGHALLLAKYYDDMGYMPESTTQKENQKKRERKKMEQVKGFTVRRHNPYKMR